MYVYNYPYLILGISAVGTTNSLLALDQLHKNQGHFHLIIMEVHMSDLDGFKLKQIIDEEFAIPVISKMHSKIFDF